MNEPSYEIIAEVAIAIAGFSGVAGALERRTGPGFSERELLALRQVIGWSGLALLFSLLPSGLGDLGLSSMRVQAICSLALGALMLALSAAVLYRNRQIARAGDPGRFQLLYLTLPLPVIAEIGALFLNGVGAIGPSAGIYRLGLITCVAFAYFVFAAWLIYRVG
jgi:hypothetical protein